MWAVRKNGEVVGGSWMLGVKLAVRYHPSSVRSGTEFFPSRIPAKQNVSSANRWLACPTRSRRLMLARHLTSCPLTLLDLPARPPPLARLIITLR
jgi:hypothetical protein